MTTHAIPNRLLAYEEKLQSCLDRGVKLTGEPITGDLAELEKGLDLTVLEQVAYQNAQARAHATGVLSTGEAQIIFQSISAGSATGWAEGVSLARKLTVTQTVAGLMGIR